MIVFRLCKREYANDLSGKGAETYGGRWNSRGTAMIYTGESRALCTTEIAVHTPLGIVPENYVMVALEIPDNQIFELPPSRLPKDWKLFPHPDSTQKIGDRFIEENNALVMKVPSAVVQGEHNFLLNPGHPSFKKVKILNVVDFDFDERLFI